MKKELKFSGLLFVKTIVLILMVIVIHFSLVTIAVSVTQPREGYVIYHSTDGGETVEEVYTHYYADGEDTRIAQYEGKEGYYQSYIPGKLSSGIQTGIGIFTTVSSLLLMIAMYYNDLWRRGDADATRKELSGVGFRKSQGLIDGAIATIPFALTWVMLVICKLANILPEYIKIYRYCNYHLFYFIDLLLPYNTTAENSLLNVLLCFLLLLPVPLICMGAYILGYKHIDIRRSLIYKKKEDV